LQISRKKEQTEKARKQKEKIEEVGREESINRRKRSRKYNRS
jgi:hypothetical protein